MSLVAPVVDGKLQTSSTSSDSLAGAKDKSSVDSDMFLTLLVAEMQNQDPLEPTSNTEWVSQYATFTQVEQMTEMGESMDLLRANSMIGKEVVMKVTSESTGETSYKRGIVDYVTVEDGEALLVIDEEKYSIGDLDSVASEEYFTAYDLYTEFVGMIEALPSLNLIDKSYENTVGKVYKLYNDLTEYQKNYIDKYAAGHVSSYEAYIKKMEQLGITFNQETTEKVTTLDDVLNAFNKKMDDLLIQISALNMTNKNNTSEGQASGIASAGNEAAGGTQPSEKAEGSEATGGTQPSEKAEGSEATGGTQPSEKAEGSEATGGTQPSEKAEGSEATGGTQPSEKAEGSEATGGTQPSEKAEGSEATGGTQPSEKAEGSEATGGTQSSEKTEGSKENDSSDASSNEQTSDGIQSGSEATGDMLDQLTQDTENV